MVFLALGGHPVSVLRTVERDRGRSRVRGVQGRLGILFEEEESSGQDKPEIALPLKVAGPVPVPASTTTTQFHPLAYRRVLSAWPDEWRERWGYRANALEEAGLSWRDAETQAFIEVWNQIRHEQTPNPSLAAAVPTSGPERN